MTRRHAQGALSTGGRFLISASGRKPALWSATDGKPAKRRRWAYGPEDLTMWPNSGRLFSLTEHPRRRAVFAVAAPKML